MTFVNVWKLLQTSPNMTVDNVCNGTLSNTNKRFQIRKPRATLKGLTNVRPLTHPQEMPR